MRYWLTSLLGVTLASAAVAAVAWCTRALIERSLCLPGDEQLACTAGPGELGAAIAVCLLVVIPIASVIFMHRTSPPGTSLGALALGIAFTAAGGTALYSAIPSDDTTVQVIGYITGVALLSIGPLMLIGGIAATGRRSSPAAAKVAAAKAAAAATGSPSAIFLSGADVRTRSTAGPGPDLARQGFGQLAALLSQVADEASRASSAGEQRGPGT